MHPHPILTFRVQVGGFVKMHPRFSILHFLDRAWRRPDAARAIGKKETPDDAYPDGRICDLLDTRADGNSRHGFYAQ